MKRWWSDSMECCCNLGNIQDILADGKTPSERRFGEPFKGPRTPFGALIECHQSSPKEQVRIHHFDEKVLPKIFRGCELNTGKFGNAIFWKRTWEDLEKFDAPRRINATEILIRQTDDDFIVSFAGWYSRIVRKRPRILRTHSKAGTDRLG